MLVPNKFPIYHNDRRIAIIGEAPGRDEEIAGQPFVGMSGRFLAALLSRAGISREACFLGNISQHRPPNNDIASFNWSGDEIQEGLYQLSQDIVAFKPNIVVLLGNVPLKAAKDPTSSHALVPKAFRYKNSQWRGSLFEADQQSPFKGYKCMATYHPAYCLRDYDAAPLLQFDLRKAVREGLSPLLVLPRRNIQVGLSIEEQIKWLRRIRQERLTVAIDIEGGIDTMSCISFATSADFAFIVPINNATTPELWRELAMTLEDPKVHKILQNSLYDRFVLHYSYGIRVQGVADDTMLKHWELYSELEKSLGLQASLYTDEPYYKFERKADDDETFFRYCCKDSAVTFEINACIEKQFAASDARTPSQLAVMKKHYALNMALLNPLLYMELRGIRYDVAGAAARRDILRTSLFEAQARLNALTGFGFSFKSLSDITQRRDALMLTKKGDRCYKEYEQPYQRVKQLLAVPSPSLATIGELETLCEVGLNVSSDKQLIPYLYDTLALPRQYKIERSKTTETLTADYEALLKLSRWCLQSNKPREYQIVQAIIEIRSLAVRQRMLSIAADSDKRIRCGYNVVGTNTGRLTCYESPTGSGYNLQTIPNYTKVEDAPGGILGDRDLFLADPDHWFFQCDLAGADGWTVAAYCAMLGDDNMLQDYLAGIKPYAKIALKIAKADVDFRDRTAIKQFLKSYKLGAIEKLMAKRVQHGGAYLEGGLTISRNILKDSEGKVYLSPGECDKLKNWYIHEMYPGIPKWHNWVAARLKESPFLVAASGQVRQFFGRPNEIITKAVAYEPQANTTYATNLAAYRLWSDTTNRIYSNNQYHLRVEPLHQVHDALCGQFKKSDTAWAVSKIQSWFDNPLEIAGQKITIPFEGNYGRSWGQLTEGNI